MATQENIALTYFRASAADAEATYSHRESESLSCRFCNEKSGILFDLEELQRVERFMPDAATGDVSKEEGVGCLACLRQGRFEMHHQTESGPLGAASLGASSDAVAEMRKTPRIRTWQMEEWLLCCSDFMIFIGSWERNDFESRAKDRSSEALFDQMCPEWEGSYQQFFGGREQRVAFYAFQCRHCDKLRGNLDNA